MTQAPKQSKCDDIRRARIRRVIRDFFKGRPPGTRIEKCDLDAYYSRLREAAREVSP